MKDLGKWQLISFVSRGLAMALGIVQTIVILRILTVSEWGIIQLAVSIGGALGIYQHLGLASASTREISSAKDDTEIFKIFVTSVFIRYFVTLPIAVGLFVFSSKIAVGLYKNEALIVPLKIYSVTLLFQGFQSILNSVISGTKRFKELFIYQVVIAVFSVVTYIPLVLLYKIEGFFLALLIFNIVGTVSLAVIAFKPLRNKLIFPSVQDFKHLFKDIFSISIAIYVVKIIYTNWEKMGNNILGLFNSPEIVAIFAFAMLFAKKLMNISDSVTDVNLPVLSEKFKTDLGDFKRVFVKNFDKVYVFILVSAFTATFWAPEIVELAVRSDKYAESYKLIPAVILAFIAYSIINIVKSSVYIPAKMTKEMIVAYGLLIIGTGLGFFGLSRFFPVLTSMSWGLALGSVSSLIYSVLIIRKKLELDFFVHDHWLIMIQVMVFTYVSTLLTWWVIKIPVFLAFSGLFVWALFIPGFLTKDELKNAKDKLLSYYYLYAKNKKTS